MTLKFQSSIGAKLFEKVEKWGDIFEKFEKIRKKKTVRGRVAPALRVLRAVTRLTVHRSLQLEPRKIRPICNFWCFFVRVDEFVLHGFIHLYFCHQVQ